MAEVRFREDLEGWWYFEKQRCGWVHSGRKNTKNSQEGRKHLV